MAIRLTTAVTLKNRFMTILLTSKNALWLHKFFAFPRFSNLVVSVNSIFKSICYGVLCSYHHSH
jgi:hypothetical protein